jgi:hypothetical protein
MALKRSQLRNSVKFTERVDRRAHKIARKADRAARIDPALRLLRPVKVPPP